MSSIDLSVFRSPACTSGAPAPPTPSGVSVLGRPSKNMPEAMACAALATVSLASDGKQLRTRIPWFPSATHLQGALVQSDGVVQVNGLGQRVHEPGPIRLQHLKHDVVLQAGHEAGHLGAVRVEGTQHWRHLHRQGSGHREGLETASHDRGVDSISSGLCWSRRRVTAGPAHQVSVVDRHSVRPLLRPQRVEQAVRGVGGAPALLQHHLHVLDGPQQPEDAEVACTKV